MSYATLLYFTEPLIEILKTYLYIYKDYVMLCVFILIKTTFN